MFCQQIVLVKGKMCLNDVTLVVYLSMKEKITVFHIDIVKLAVCFLKT